MMLWFSQGKMGSLGQPVEEASDQYGVEGFSHIQENRSG
jgi:hypothetical protein